MKVKTTYTVEMSPDELAVLADFIGKTSETGRKSSPWQFTSRQSQLLGSIYCELSDAYPEYEEHFE